MVRMNHSFKRLAKGYVFINSEYDRKFYFELWTDPSMCGYYQLRIFNKGLPFSWKTGFEDWHYTDNYLWTWFWACDGRDAYSHFTSNVIERVLSRTQLTIFEEACKF